MLESLATRMAALDPVCACIEPKCASKPATMGCCCCCDLRTAVITNGVIFALSVSLKTKPRFWKPKFSTY